MQHRIFLSSTFTVLVHYRRTVQSAIRQLGAIDVSMEHFGARDERPGLRKLSSSRRNSAEDWRRTLPVPVVCQRLSGLTKRLPNICWQRATSNTSWVSHVCGSRGCQRERPAVPTTGNSLEADSLCSTCPRPSDRRAGRPRDAGAARGAGSEV